jgi:hypothetical protein
MKTKVLVSWFLFAALAAVAGPEPKPSAPAVAPGKSAAVAVRTADFPVICYLEKQGQVITVKSSPHGTVYSVKSTEGKTLYENLSAEQLRAQAPELHEFVKTAVAGPRVRGDARVRAVKLDASLGSR